MVMRVAGMALGIGMLLAAQTQVVQPPIGQQPAPSQAIMAQPGALNYVEGQASLNGRTLTRQDIGRVEVGAGQMLETQQGRAELLLTPGVFLRLGDQSAVRMVNPSISNTQVEVVRGSAMLEAAGVEKENHLVVLDHGVSTPIEKRGIYEFRADPQAAVLVFEGHVDIQQGKHTTYAGKGREVVLGQNKALKFDRDSAEGADPLYSWSKVRSQYEAEASQSVAQSFAYGAPGWYGEGWYWDPYFDMFGFMPGDGFLYSPFGVGWGFWSPGYYGAYLGYGGFGYGRYGYRGGFAGRPGFAASSRLVTPRSMGYAGRAGLGGSVGGRMGGFGGHVGGFGGHMGGFAGGHMGGGGRR